MMSAFIGAGKTLVVAAVLAGLFVVAVGCTGSLAFTAGGQDVQGVRFEFAAERDLRTATYALLAFDACVEAGGDAEMCANKVNEYRKDAMAVDSPDGGT